MGGARCRAPAPPAPASLSPSPSASKKPSGSNHAVGSCAPGSVPRGAGPPPPSAPSAAASSAGSASAASAAAAPSLELRQAPSGAPSSSSSASASSCRAPGSSARHRPGLRFVWRPRPWPPTNGFTALAASVLVVACKPGGGRSFGSVKASAPLRLQQSSSGRTPVSASCTTCLSAPGRAVATGRCCWGCGTAAEARWLPHGPVRCQASIPLQGRCRMGVTGQGVATP